MSWQFVYECWNTRSSSSAFPGLLRHFWILDFWTCEDLRLMQTALTFEQIFSLFTMLGPEKNMAFSFLTCWQATHHLTALLFSVSEWLNIKLQIWSNNSSSVTASSMSWDMVFCIECAWIYLVGPLNLQKLIMTPSPPDSGISSSQNSFDLTWQSHVCAENRGQVSLKPVVCQAIAKSSTRLLHRSSCNLADCHCQTPTAESKEKQNNCRLQGTHEEGKRVKYGWKILIFILTKKNP